MINVDENLVATAEVGMLDAVYSQYPVLRLVAILII